MEKLPLCRVCLAGNVRMYGVVNKNLRELYEKLTDNPFVTEDSRPMLVCYFCCTKLKKCFQFQRQCLEAEELYTQMMNEDNKLNPLLNQDHPEFCFGLIQTPIQLINIVSECQTQSVAIKEELPAVCERLDDDIELKEEYQSNELELENQKYIFFDVESIPAHNCESDSEDDKPLMEFKTEVEDHKILRTKRRASDAQQLELDNVDTSYQDVEDTPALHAQSDSAVEPLIEIKIKVEDEQESTGAPVAKMPKLDTRRQKPSVTISDKEKINENNRKSVSKIVMKSQNHTSNRTTTFKKPFTKTQHVVSGSVNNTVLSTSLRNSRNRDNIKFKISNKGVDNDKKIKKRRMSVSEKRFECEICQRSFSKKCHLICHVRTHTGEKPFKCDTCQLSFNQKQHMVSHTRTHTGEKPFKCVICQRSFNEKSNLVKHTRTHTDEKPFKCAICQRSFNKMSNLVRHTRRNHTGEKPFKCEICQRCYNDKYDLAKHTRTHTGEKPFNCDICQRSFNDKYHLVRHTRIHTGEKPFKCDICQRSFNEKSNLVSHTHTHTLEKPFKCDMSA